MCAPAFFDIGCLLAADRQKFFFGHVGPGENPSFLLFGARRYDDHDVDVAITASFEEQRHIEYTRWRASLTGSRQKTKTIESY